MRLLATWVHGHRRLVATVVLLMTAVTLAGASRVRYLVDIRNMFRTEDRRMEVLEAIYRDFGADDHDCSVVLEADDLFAADVVDVLRALTERVRSIAGVEAVFSLADAIVFETGASPRPLLPPPGASAKTRARARAEALAHPLVGGRLLSANGRTTVVFVRLSDDIDSLEFLRDPANPLQSVVDAAVRDSDVSATLTGIPVVRAELLAELLAVRHAVLHRPARGAGG